MTDPNNRKLSVIAQALELYPYFQRARRKQYPDWFSRLNILSILPVFLWPCVFYGSLFLFDNPSNMGSAFLKFILVNIYPIVILTLSRLSYMLFRKARTIAVIIPALLVATWAVLLFFVLTSPAITFPR